MLGINAQVSEFVEKYHILWEARAFKIQRLTQEDDATKQETCDSFWICRYNRSIFVEYTAVSGNTQSTAGTLQSVRCPI